MDPLDILNMLFQYSLLHLYSPIITAVGFSHPLTFTIITVHNTFSVTYLLFASAIAYPALHEKTWLIPAGVTTVWIALSVSVITTLKIPATTAMAAVLPHGWLEFAAIAYWANAIRKATRDCELPKPVNVPTFRDYLGALTKPKSFVILAKTDFKASFGAAKASLRVLCRRLKKAYITTFVLIASAALVETYVTPFIVLLIG